MTFTVGGVDVAKVYLGSTPVDAVYLGAEKVWPTALPLTWRMIKGTQAATGTIWTASGDRFHLESPDLDGQPVDVRSFQSSDILFDAGPLGTHLCPRTWYGAASDMTLMREASTRSWLAAIPAGTEVLVTPQP